MKKEKFDQLVRDLKSQEENIALRAVSNVRKTGEPEILPVLAKLMLSSNNEKLVESIKSIFIDLKDPRAAAIMTEIIDSPDFTSDKAFFVSTCWQSKVDYSEYLGFFVDIVIGDEMTTSIEALTVIEEMLGPFDETELMDSLDRVHEYLDFPTNENEALVSALPELLQSRLDNNIEQERFN